MRKLLVALDLKGVDYEIDPFVPYYGGDAFTRLSPVRRIPVLIDGDISLCDSTLIAEYLDERHPSPPLWPKSPAERARARWLEEYADTRMGDVLREAGAPISAESLATAKPQRGVPRG